MEPSEIIRNWMSNRNSFAFYSLWEELNNPDFNSVESHGIKINEVPYNRFTMTPARWKKDLNAELIEMGIKQPERLIKLNHSAKKQMELLQNNMNIKVLS